MSFEMVESKCKNRLEIFAERYNALSQSQKDNVEKGSSKMGDCIYPSFAGPLHHNFSHYDFSQEKEESIL